MKLWKFGLSGLLIGLALTACNINNASEPRMDVTLNPSPIAQYDFQAPQMATDSAEPVTVVLAPRPGVLPPTNAAPPPTSVPEAAAQPTTEAAAQPTAPPPTSAVPTPTSNFEEIKALEQNPTVVIKMEMDSSCFVAEDFIPFRLIVTSLETEPIYFYKNGRWRFSINNSPLGPDLSSLEPSIRDDFVELQSGESYVVDEEDLGSWVLSLGPNANIPTSSTGLGLPAGDYWVTFVYDNDQDGLREQPDGTYLIDRAAWRGTVIAPEVRFKVVSNLSEC